MYNQDRTWYEYLLSDGSYGSGLVHVAEDEMSVLDLVTRGGRRGPDVMMVQIGENRGLNIMKANENSLCSDKLRKMKD